MIKKQVDFQVASYIYPNEAKLMREEVRKFQADGWEVLQPIHGGVRKDEGARDVDLLLLPVVKYEWVDETVALAKKAGRPKKAE